MGTALAIKNGAVNIARNLLISNTKMDFKWLRGLYEYIDIDIDQELISCDGAPYAPAEFWWKKHGDFDPKKDKLLKDAITMMKIMGYHKVHIKPQKTDQDETIVRIDDQKEIRFNDLIKKHSDKVDQLSTALTLKK